MRRGFVLLLVALAAVFVPASGASGAKPNSKLTPGDVRSAVTQANISTTICVAGYAESARRVSSTTRNRVFGRYHVKHNDRGKYVIDHLIPLELGGSNRLANLWPQPKGDAKRKDRVESKMHAAVCDGRISLTLSQTEFAHDWTFAAKIIPPTTTTTSSTTTTTVYVPPPPPPPPPPAPPPAPGGGATALCNDGTYSYAAHHQGACSHHGGVAVFYK